MAFTVSDLANGTSIASGTTIVTGATVTGTVAAKDWFVVVAVKGSATNDITSVSDSSGNTYTERVFAETGDSTTGRQFTIYTAPVSVDISNGIITVTMAATSGASRAVQVYRVRPGASQSISFIGAGNTSGANTTNHEVGPVNVTSGDLIVCGAVIKTSLTITGDSDTTNGSWSSIVTRLADNGSDTLRAAASSQYKAVTGTGDQTWTATTASAKNSIGGHVVLRLSTTAITAGAGSYALTGTAATFSLVHKITAAAGSYALTGTAATLKQARRPTAGAGSYALTGTAASLTKSFGSKTLAAAAGAYTLTGTAATLLHKCKIAAGAGSYALTGAAANPTKGVSAAGASSDGRPTVERTGEGYSEEDAKEARRNKWEAEQFRLKLDAMYDGREYVERPFPEDITPAQHAAAAAQAAAERAAMFQAMLTEQQARQRANLMAQQFAMRQAQDEEDAATIAVMGD